MISPDKLARPCGNANQGNSDTKMGYFCRHVIGGVDPDALRDGGALQMEEEEEEPVKEEMHN